MSLREKWEDRPMSQRSEHVKGMRSCAKEGKGDPSAPVIPCLCRLSTQSFYWHVPRAVFTSKSMRRDTEMKRKRGGGLKGGPAGDIPHDEDGEDISSKTNEIHCRNELFCRGKSAWNILYNDTVS